MSVIKNIKNRKQAVNELSLISQEKLNQYLDFSDDVEEQYNIFQLKIGMPMRDRKTKKKFNFLSICENENDLILVDEDSNEIVWYNKKDIEPA